MKQQIDRFILSSPLGGGGAGSVYLAEEILPGDARRPVALKVLPTIGAGDKAAETRFFAEVKALAGLGGNAHIVTFYGMGMTEGTPWLAMEYVAGNVGGMIGEEPGAAGDVRRLAEHVARGLEFMHGREPAILHNDLKPANILMDAGGCFKLTDFGLASLAAMERTHVLATVRYAAPELLSREFGKICAATDLYALGHIAYELALGGRLYRKQFPAVFEGATGGGGSSKEAPPAKWMQWHCSLTTQTAAVHEVVKDFPRGVSEVIAKLMAKPLDQRYAGAGEVLRDLKAGEEMQGAAGEKSAGGGGQRLGGGAVVAGAVRAAPAVVGTGGGGAASSAERYYVRLRGRTSGPFDLATLQRQARQGLISRLHQVSADQVNWRGAGTVEGLFGH